MKLVLLGDVHLRSSNPENRIDNYEESMWEKIRFVLDHKKALNRVVLQPGDLFDGPTQSNALLARCFDELSNHIIQVTFGQHDMKYRTRGNTALDVLVSGGIVDSRAQRYTAEGVQLYVCAFDEEIPKIENEDCFNILLIHRMIVEDKLWEGQVEYTWANTILRQNKFDLIVSGDNHQSFIVEHKDRLLVNCGSLMRTRKDQINHKPMFVIYDTETREYEKIFIPVKPAAEVFDLAMLKKEEEKDEKLAAFVSGLEESVEIGLEFKANLYRAIKANKIAKPVVDILEEMMYD